MRKKAPAADVIARGWTAYFPVVNRKADLRADRELRVDINQDALVALYDAIEEEFGSDEALFVTAYRLNGPDGENGDSDTGQGPAAPAGRSGSVPNHTTEKHSNPTPHATSRRRAQTNRCSERPGCATRET